MCEEYLQYLPLYITNLVLSFSRNNYKHIKTLSKPETEITGVNSFTVMLVFTPFTTHSLCWFGNQIPFCCA